MTAWKHPPRRHKRGFRIDLLTIVGIAFAFAGLGLFALKAPNSTQPVSIHKTE